MSTPQNRDPKELVARAFTEPGAEPMAVRQTGGAVRYASQAYGASRAKVTAEGGVLGDAEPAAPASTSAHTDDTRAMVSGVTSNFDAARLYLVMTGGGANAKATVTAHRVNDDGDIVKAATFTDLAPLTEIRDAGIGHRATLYRISAITLDGASGITLCVAGEGAST
jgi:hypothetical protein